MPGAASHTYGIAFTQCIAGAIRPISGRSPITGGCRPWNVDRNGRLRVELDLEPLAVEPPRGFEVLLAHQPVHAYGDHRLTVDQTLPGESLRGDSPRLEHPDRRVEVLGRDGHLVGRALLRVELPAEPGGDHVDRLREPVTEHRRHRARGGLLRRRPEEHHLAHDRLGRVVADVRELLHPHVLDVAAQRGEHQREPFGDAAGVDAGAVQRGAAAPARVLEQRGLRATPVGRSTRPA